ncbi:MAG TPA: glycine cleavage T C-terminal barrel domain-containing protein [Bryobacteraceae bacterium]|nr:glycine cleavage T C-terminal barrel domain-containing protein [Bryobacteraceae bacterium]
MTAGYRALHESAAWLDLTGRGKIVARGQDRARLLHAMTTNHVEQLQAGGGCYAFFLDAHGHILGDVNILVGAEHHLLDTEPEVAERLYRHLDRHIIADDVMLQDVTSETATLALEGPEAADLLALVGAPVPASDYEHTAWGEATVARVSLTGAGGFLLFVPRKDRDSLAGLLTSAGAVPAIPEDALVVRLESGKPRCGVDIAEDCLPQETQQMHALHSDKGCYIGQEIVERVRSRGHVNRLLVRLAIEGEQPPASGVTSAAYSPALGKVVAFAYLRAEQARPGSKVIVDDRQAEVLSPGRLGI